MEGEQAMKHDLSDDQWKKIKDSLPGQKCDPGRTAEDNRKFISAVMWIARNGAPWRALPAEYDKWSSVHKRFIRWAKAGVWQMIFNTLGADADTEWVMIDSTMIRAHQHAAGARKKNSQWYARTRAGQVSRRFHYETPRSV
jgi:transposase